MIALECDHVMLATRARQHADAFVREVLLPHFPGITDDYRDLFHYVVERTFQTAFIAAVESGNEQLRRSQPTRRSSLRRVQVESRKRGRK